MDVELLRAVWREEAIICEGLVLRREEVDVRGGRGRTMPLLALP